MKALTLTQPWATLVAIGEKRIETRSWSTRYRGPIAIHAAKGFPAYCRELCLDPEFSAALVRGTATLPLPLGEIVAIGKIIGCGRTEEFSGIDEKERSFGDYYPGRYGWVIADVKRLELPIPCKGALGLWDVPEEIAVRLRRVAA